MRLQDEVDRIAAGALAPGAGSDVVGHRFDLFAGVGNGNRQSADAQYGQVDHVVTDVGDLVEGERPLLHDLADGLNLVVLAHEDVLHTQGTGTLGDGFGGPLGDDSGMDTTDPGKRNAYPIVGVEPFGFKDLFRPGWCIGLRLAGGGFGKGPDLAIGKDAVDVEKDQADAAGALFSCGKIHFFILLTCRELLLAGVVQILRRNHFPTLFPVDAQICVENQAGRVETVSHFPSLPAAAETGKDVPEQSGKDVPELDKKKA